MMRRLTPRESLTPLRSSARRMERIASHPAVPSMTPGLLCSGVPKCVVGRARRPPAKRGAGWAWARCCLVDTVNARPGPVYFLGPLRAPPRVRSSVPDSARSRCTKP
jgi:hypothetical protein